MEFVIETGMAKPKPVRAHGGRASQYPFANMQIGQSFKVKFGSTEEKETVKVERKVRAAITSFKNKEENKHFVLSTRTVTGKEEKENGVPGIRIYRDEPKPAVTV
ncbi:MAG TPA: hypothetical protein VNX68_11220 [Nitrosopumilaceae archaeon]|jgi:hypothetical protein|nr:hypothetical protein [Nitrosopumilaceae archaeon]